MPQHRFRDRDTVCLRTVPLFGANVHPAVGVIDCGRVTGGEDIRRRGGVILVDENAVTDRQACAPGQRGIGFGTDGDQGGRGGPHPAVHRDRPDSIARVVDAGQYDRIVNIDTVVQVQFSAVFPDHRRDDTCERSRSRVYDLHLDAQTARGRSDLTSDQAAADDQYRTTVDHRRAQRIGVRRATQSEGAVLGSGQLPRPGAGGEDQGVVAERGAVGRMHPVAVDVDLGDRGRTPQIDIQFAPRLRRFEQQAPLIRGACQQFLGHHRPSIRQVRLGAEDDDLAGVSLGAQGPGRGGTGDSRAGDDDASGHARLTSTISKSALAAPQSGQDQSSGMSSQRVPGSMPSSGQPSASSYSKPHCTQRNSL